MAFQNGFEAVGEYRPPNSFPSLLESSPASLT